MQTGKGGRSGVQRLSGTSEDLCHGAARKPASEKSVTRAGSEGQGGKKE